MRLVVKMALGLALGLAGLGCKPKLEQPAPPKHSVGLVAPVRGSLTQLAPGQRKAQAVDTDRRVEDGAVLHTGPHGKATLVLDMGGWILLDKNTQVHVGERALKVRSGRIWVDAHGAQLTVSTEEGDITSADASFDVERGKRETKVYCGSAEITLKTKKQTLRLVSGMLATLKGGKIDPQLQKVWDDWTGGMAQAGPREHTRTAGVGVLEARRTSEIGYARSPLLVREHAVRAEIKGALAVTEVEQHFFNPRSQVVEGTYRVRLPPGAIISAFAAGRPDSLQAGRIVSRTRVTGGKGSGDTILEWEAPDRYVATIQGIGAGATTVIKLTYVQWLENRRGRRRFVYPMGGGGAPRLGEFSLAVDVAKAQAKTLKAGMGAKREGNKVIVRRSDFRPTADFVLELLSEKAKTPTPTLVHARAETKGEPAYAALTLIPPFGEQTTKRPPLRLVLVADVSAGTGEAELAMTRQVIDAILRQLTPKDQVAVLVASVDAKALGEGKALAPATAKRREALLGALSRIAPGGGSDLEQALLSASKLLPKGLGSVIYVGDGQPTLGTLAPGLLRDRLARRLTPPRLFAVGVGDHAAMELLHAITDGLGFAAQVRLLGQAPRTALRIVAHAARPTLRHVTVDLGPTLDRVYPRRPVTVEAGTSLQVLGRLRGKAPKIAWIRGLRNGKPFRKKIELRALKVRDQGDLQRRWAFARIQDLLRRGAGREAVAEVGVRYGVITPFTGMVVGAHSAQKWYQSRLPDDPAGTYIPEALRGGPPAGRITIALEPGWSTENAQPIALESLYQRALHRKLWTAVRASFDRKAAARPDLSGQVTLEVQVNPDGGVHKVTLKKEQSTLKDPDVEGDILRLVQSVQLPATPTGERFTFTHRFTFRPQDITDVPQRCLNKDGTRKRSPESYKYLDVRRALWRERLYRNRTPVGAHRVWMGALACGEIRLDTDARALLRLIIAVLGTTGARVDFFQRMSYALPWVRGFLRREILRRVRTLADVRQVRAGLALDGGLDHKLLKRMLDKAKTDAERLDVVRRFLALMPDSLTLRRMLMHFCERTNKLDEATRTAWALRADPAADAGIRQQVGEFFLRRKNTAEARRSFSELVEFAPYDPWARRRLGNLLMAQAAEAAQAKPATPAAKAWIGRLYRDAYREYETLAWLTPGANTVLLLMANAAAGMQRLDWALRLQHRVSESAEVTLARTERQRQPGGGERGPAAWARLLTTVRLAQMRLSAKGEPSLTARLKARARQAGIYTWARDLTLALTWSHPDAALSLWLRYPGQEKPVQVGVRGGAVGIEGVRHQLAEIWGAAARRTDRRGATDVANTPLYVEIRCGDTKADRVQSYQARLVMIWNEGQAKERTVTQTLTFDPKTKALAFLLQPTGTLLKTEVVKPARDRAQRPE